MALHDDQIDIDFTSSLKKGGIKVATCFAADCRMWGSLDFVYICLILGDFLVEWAMNPGAEFVTKTFVILVL
jgi:hypothetical protein